jgi:hypothetical protein
MFRRIATDAKSGTVSDLTGSISPSYEDRAKALFRLHPMELFALLEMAWSFRVNKNNALGDPRHKTDLKSMPESLLQLFPFYETNQKIFLPNFPVSSVVKTRTAGFVLWDHLIYAYIIESTQIYRIFHKLIKNYAQGDFEINLNAETLQWLHNTEMLWFADPPVFSSFNMVSHLRDDMGSTRRTAYDEMFGFTLPADTNADGKPYPFHHPKSTNTNFRRNFERIGEESWVGINYHNKGNTTIGPDPTDDESIQFNAFEMQKNFLAQRNNGDITKQEFFYVAMMSWFHLTLEFNSPVVAAFGINEQSPAQRLFALANIVGVPANGLSENLFRLADAMSLLLTLVETGIFNNNARILYDETITGNVLPGIMRRIIFNYSQVTGRDLKVREGQNIASYPLQKGNGIPSGSRAPAEVSATMMNGL